MFVYVAKISTPMNKNNVAADSLSKHAFIIDIEVAFIGCFDIVFFKEFLLAKPYCAITNIWVVWVI